jgi:hypothetical protein
VIARSRPRNESIARGHAHFELATELERRGNHAAAIRHFREAHRLVPDSWTFRRQAWSLEPGMPGALARFWQGPPQDDPASWPYEGDWLSDIRKSGAENYNERLPHLLDDEADRLGARPDVDGTGSAAAVRPGLDLHPRRSPTCWCWRRTDR